MSAVSSSGAEFLSQPVLALFPDAVYLREYLKECAKLFFGEKDGSRTAELIDGEIFSDLLIFPTEKKYTVETCSRILEESMLLPVEREKKLIILTDFQTASPLVQNKLLKLLEEPPKGVSFLIGATSSQPILPTVLSRVKLLTEPPFSEEEILGALKRKYPGSDSLRLAAGACGGCFSMAEHLCAGDGQQFSLAEEFLERLDFSSAEELGKSKEPLETIAALRAILRDLYFLEKGFPQYACGIKRTALMREYPPGVLLFALDELDRIETNLNFNMTLSNGLIALSLKIKEEIDKWKRLS